MEENTSSNDQNVEQPETQVAEQTQQETTTPQPVAQPVQPQPVQQVVQQPVVQYVDANGNPVQNVQYVVQEKSLTGIGGWLIFWLIYFGGTALYGLIFTFVWLAALTTGMLEGTALAIMIESVIFTPIICAAAITTIIMISMQKKLGKTMAIATFGASALYSIVVAITSMFAQMCTPSYDGWYYSSRQVCTGVPAAGVIMLIGTIIVAIVSAGLFSLYFIKSKRVALTLTK